MDSRPIILHTEVVVPSNADTEAPAGPMMNSSGSDIEIHSFKFSVRPSNAAIAQLSADGPIQPVSGGQFGVAITVKNEDDEGYALTKGPIPLWGFGPAYGLGDEIALQVLGIFSDAATFAAVPTATYIWKLDHPLRVPAGACIVPVFRSIGNFTYDVLAGMTAVGCTVEHSGKQATYKVPWVSSFISSSDRYDDAQKEESSPKALQNPNDKPVYIERFVGRMHIFTDFTTAVPVTSVTDTALYAGDLGTLISGTLGIEEAAEGWFDRTISIQMSDSMGNPLVRVPTLFRSVFEPATRTWEVKHILPPEQYFRVLLYKDNANYSSGELRLASSPMRSQVSITMVGWREVSWQKGVK